MVNGLYTASESMSILQNKVDNTSHSLANANTTGFKESFMVTESLVEHKRNDEHLLHQDESQDITQNYINFDQGSLIPTESPFDLAIEGEGFFEVETEDGVRYTRNGSFALNSLSELVTLNGDFVLDSGGSHITVDGSAFNVAAGGFISVDGKNSSKIAVVEFDDMHALERVGKAQFAIKDGESPSLDKEGASKVRQGMLEGSNVNIVDSMVEMIRFQRQYESNQKSIQSIDGTLEKAVNEIGSVR